MKKALIIATVAGFVASFEASDISILQSMGYEVHCATNTLINNHPEKFDYLQECGLVSHHIEFSRSPFSRKNIGAYIKLNKLIRDEKFDLIHCHTPVGGVMGRLAGHRNNVREVIYSAHGFHFFKGAPIKNWLLFYPVEKYLSKWTDKLITINADDYKIALKKFKAKHTYKINDVGVDISRFKNTPANVKDIRNKLDISDDCIFMLTVGELSADKNQIVVLDALKCLEKKDKKRYVFAIAGRGAEQEKIELYSQELGISQSVKLLGYRSDIPELLSACDIFVFPSKFEGISVALMEAIAAKKTIICSKVRGNIDLIVNDEYMFTYNDPNELASKIMLAANNDNTDSIEANWKNLQKFSISNVKKQMKEIYLSN